MNRFFTTFFLPIFCAFILFVPNVFSQNIFRFDFADAHQVENEDYQLITLDKTPTTFQWLEQSMTPFYHPKFKAIRQQEWLDGLQGKNIQFTIELEEGNWLIQAAFEAGLEFISSMEIEINGEKQTLGWHGFRPPPVPLQKITEHFRIWQGKINCSKKQKVTFHFKGVKDLVRLMSLELVKEASPKNAKEKWILDQIELVGKWKNRNLPLEPILGALKLELIADPQNAFAYYYLQQVGLLQRVEKIVDLKGWEWAKKETRMSMIDRQQQGAMLLDPILTQSGHLLEERARWLRAKFLYHLDLEYRYEGEKEQAIKDFKFLLERYPDAQLIQMYNGTRIPIKPIEGTLTVAQNAPVWSKMQLKAMNRLQKIIHYWVEERQASNGEFGGKLGDDVEALRFWHPLIYTNDSLAILGWTRLADGVWYSNQVELGYAKRVDDVEHASEFISDTAPLLLVASDDTTYHNRVLYTLAHFYNLWTDLSPSGKRLFKSAWYSATKIELDSPKNRDVQYNSRALTPLRYWLWRYPEDEKVKKALYDWAKAWAEIAEKTVKGKPKGILPPSIRLEDEAINGDEKEWYKANMYWEYFDFTGEGYMLDHLLFCWQYTKDAALLKPITASLQLIRDHYQPEKQNQLGSKAWAAEKMAKSKTFWGVIGQWRVLTGNTDFDALLLLYAPHYIRYQITKEEKHLLAGLEKFNQSTGYNWEMLTSEVVFTDRLLATDVEYGQRLDSEILKAMLTGDVIVSSTSPYLCVTWSKTFEGFTALVKGYSPKTLNVELYNHSSKTEKAAFRIWHLPKGTYRLKTNTGEEQIIKIRKAGEQVAINCPSQKLLNIEIVKV